MDVSSVILAALVLPKIIEKNIFFHFFSFIDHYRLRKWSLTWFRSSFHFIFIPSDTNPPLLALCFYCDLHSSVSSQLLTLPSLAPTRSVRVSPPIVHLAALPLPLYRFVSCSPFFWAYLWLFSCCIVTIRVGNVREGLLSSLCSTKSSWLLGIALGLCVF